MMSAAGGSGLGARPRPLQLREASEAAGAWRREDALHHGGHGQVSCDWSTPGHVTSWSPLIGHLDSLLRRIVALIPDTVAIERRKTIALDFLTGRTSRMKKLKKLRSLPSDTRDLFYLLADYAFKSNSDMETAINYYAIDLTFNRFALLCCVSIFLSTT